MKAGSGFGPKQVEKQMKERGRTKLRRDSETERGAVPAKWMSEDEAQMLDWVLN